MRSNKLAISALVVTSLFGSTLIASAQNQPAPGAANEGTISPGATGKKTQKGTTTGSTTRIGSRQRWFRGRHHGCSEKRQQILTLFSEADVPFESKGPGAIRGPFCMDASSYRPNSRPVSRTRETANSERAATCSKNA
jgi:hypothetical protein